MLLRKGKTLVFHDHTLIVSQGQQSVLADVVKGQFHSKSVHRMSEVGSELPNGL